MLANQLSKEDENFLMFCASACADGFYGDEPKYPLDAIYMQQYQEGKDLSLNYHQNPASYYPEVDEF